MANIIYNGGLSRMKTVDMSAGATVIRCMLERSTSTYSPDKDHRFVSDLSDFVEISVSSYERQTVGSKAVNIDDSGDIASFTFGNVSFGSLESGQEVKALVFYFQVGGDDTTPGTDVLLCRIDTATGLPATLGGGEFLITIHADGFINTGQAA